MYIIIELTIFQGFNYLFFYPVEHMLMSKPHKELALFMVQLAESSDISECDMIKEIRNKIRELSIHNIPPKVHKKSLKIIVPKFFPLKCSK